MTGDWAESRIARLRSECVRVMGRRPGCGFAVAPGWLVTCAHVIGRETPLGEAIEVCPWQGAVRRPVLRHLAGDTDLALLEDHGTTVATAVFGDAAQRNELLVGIGFPVRDGQPEFDEFSAHYESITQLADSTTGGELSLIKLKGGHIDYGFSGGPLVSFTSGRVVGLTRLSRDTQLDLGGWAVPAAAVRAFCRGAGVPLPLDEVDRQETPGVDLVTRFRDLLLGLPGWNSRRRRVGFLEVALGKGHRVLSEVELEGGARPLAWEVASACEDYPEPTAAGLSPWCALLAAIPREFGSQAARDDEIANLRRLLRCPPKTLHRD